jgi:hypothetical protein
LVANRKEVYFETLQELFLVTSIHSRLLGPDTPVVIVKGDEGVAVVYLAGGCIHVCDSSLGSTGVYFERLAD